MQTVFDWLALALFAMLAVLFLHRSTTPKQTDRIIDYLPPAVGCALANYFGNHDHPVIGALVLVIVIVNILIVLKPFARA